MAKTEEHITETTTTLQGDENTEKYEKILEKRDELKVFLEDGNKVYPIKKKSFQKIIEVMPKKKELSINYVSFSAVSTTEIEERTEMLKKKKTKAMEKETIFKINIPKSHPMTLTFKPDNDEFDLFKTFFEVRENKKKLPKVDEEVNVPEEEKKPQPKKVKPKKTEEKKPEEKKPEEKKPEEKKPEEKKPEEKKPEEKKPEEKKPEEKKTEEKKEQEEKPTKLRGKKKEKGQKKEESKKEEEPKKEEPKKEEKPEDSKTKLRGAKKPKQEKKEDKKEEKEDNKREDKKRDDDNKGSSDKRVEYQIPVQYTEYAPSNKVQYAHHWRTHPRTYGKDSRYCRVCRNTHGLIRKYGLMICRKCFRERYTLIGFKCTK